MENAYPGLWQLWFKKQCVTDGHSPYDQECKMMGGKTKGQDDWIKTRNALNKMKHGDLIVVALPDRRIGRIGEVIRKMVKDEEWDPLFPGDSDWKKGYMGRRILVRWEIDQAPDSAELVVQLPDGINMGRGTLRQVHSPNVERFRSVIANQANWVPVTGRFGYERALSDYIAQFPHKLKPGLEPYPNEKIREKVFGDGSRSDVLLRDDVDRNPVIVECKQDSPTQEDVRQLRRYIKNLKRETREQASGILVHGGARTVGEKVWHEAKGSPRVEFFYYKLDVDFSSSCRPGHG
jgi:hypothetical protein